MNAQYCFHLLVLVIWILMPSTNCNTVDTDFVVSRHVRSLEGESCSPAGINGTKARNCTLAYTVCNPETHKCECNKNVSVSMKMPMFPEVVECIPLDYVKTTETQILYVGQCLPTSPDICSLITPGGYCDTSKQTEKGGQMKCVCQIGGTYPNCTVRIDSLCKNNATCLKDIPNSYCGNIVDGVGKCMCGLMADGKRYISDKTGTSCKPINCAANPCHGDPASITCVNVDNGYKCNCNNNTKGRSHSFDVEGICCPANQIPCLDLKKCISIEDQCNGKSDCEDCSDEKQFYCVNNLPTDNLQCSQIRERDPLKSGSNIDQTDSTGANILPGIPVVASIPLLASSSNEFKPLSVFSGPFLNPASIPVRTTFPNWSE